MSYENNFRLFAFKCDASQTDQFEYVWAWKNVTFPVEFARCSNTMLISFLHSVEHPSVIHDVQMMLVTGPHPLPLSIPGAWYM